MIDVAKLLTDNPNTEALMTEIYDFEESLAKVSRIECLEHFATYFTLFCFRFITTEFCCWHCLRHSQSVYLSLLNIACGYDMSWGLKDFLKCYDTFRVP